MPCTGRAAVGGMRYHVINRGNAQNEVFHKSGDYQAFVELIGSACARIPMRLLVYWVMPNHFHLALWPYSDSGPIFAAVKRQNDRCVGFVEGSRTNGVLYI